VKIALNLNQKDTYTPDGEDQEKAIERDVQACKRGDWEAKTRLTQAFMPLMTSLARKRSTETAGINRYIEAGKEGLLYAVRHYKPASNAKFQIFALPHIEDSMDRIDRPGFFARLLGRS
jgi:DNA-directed RNA polymerase specialized sigma subunit